MDSSLTLKLGCNHHVKRRPCRTAAGPGPSAVVKLFVRGFQAGVLFFFPVSERSAAHVTSSCLEMSASTRVFYTHLSPTTLFGAITRAAFHRLQFGEHSGGLCLHVCCVPVCVCDAAVLFFSVLIATFHHLYQVAVVGQYTPQFSTLLPPIFFLPSERCVRQEDSIP